MLQHDYILMLVTQFVQAISDAMIHAYQHQDMRSIKQVEQAIGDLLQLDPDTTLMLTPESLVTMMNLSGIGDTVAGYAAYALNKLSSLYERRGDTGLADTRIRQARAVAVAFGWDLSEVPEALKDLDKQIS